MKLVALSGSNVGTKTRTVMEYVSQAVMAQNPDVEVTLIDLAEEDMVFSDGRNYTEYTGDTRRVTQTIMDADALVIGTPIFQASIPATLKNIFDLLPVDAFRDKIAAMVATAGSAKHYLIPQQQLNPILSYMKAQVVHPYVFVEEKDLLRNQIVNDDVLARLDRLVEDTLVLTRTYASMREEKEASYGF
ncbi:MULTISPECIES: NADPH-dependent FMN reductase [Brevibacterium]|uniref:FMN reductase n=1 Tax=Brevibacterium aurantiacum TaxID=273384 RepID=A0A2A3ZID3_BREAU|nr:MULTISPECIES: NADPH-dependent FMN reductase [Brevibacterium]MDN5586731.1 NAD(P)H-dependent oxidoreductase [Brevibacterium sp.]MDN5656491.1 NAD(P)H-dependent oxidoreductase [Brevibacterium sandarakinum]PCC51284.1 FMN reductase [Brevibacterium aurantiacum]RCS89012.1 NAD(P)H-dependent oxidoreductase [Brevibacterium aurantiacum]